MSHEVTLPSLISGPAAWVGTDMANNEDAWLYNFTSNDIAELEAAANYYFSLGRDVGEISAADFPLGRFAGHLKYLQQKLLHGTGIEVIRGLPISGYTQEFTATIFCGIGVHLGNARSQNAAGHILGHVLVQMTVMFEFIKPLSARIFTLTAMMSWVCYVFKKQNKEVRRCW